MHLFIAADTYLHHPRNFFGFKKRGADPEPRLLATALGTSAGETLHSAQYRAKLRDDPRYPDDFKLPEWSYGKPKSTGYNLDDIAIEVANNPCEGVLFSGDSLKAIEAACERVYGGGIESIMPNVAVGDFDDFLVRTLYKMDHRDLALLSGADYFASTIPLSPDLYSFDEVRELWNSCVGRLSDNPGFYAVSRLSTMRYNYDEVTFRIPKLAKSLRNK